MDFRRNPGGSSVADRELVWCSFTLSTYKIIRMLFMNFEDATLCVIFAREQTFIVCVAHVAFKIINMYLALRL